MGPRILAILLALMLVPTLGMAQRGGFGGGHSGGTHAGSGHAGGGHGGSVGGGMHAAPMHTAPSAGIVTHPGGAVVVSPFVAGRVGAGISTGGLGRGVAPFISSRHFGNQVVVRSNRFFVSRPFRPEFRHFFPGGTVFFGGVPFGYPFFFGGYTYTMLDDFGYPAVTAPVVPQSPTVIVVEPSGQTYVQQAPSSAQSAMIYEPSATVPEKPAKPLTLLVFKDHSIYAATDYYRQGDRMCFGTNYGLSKCVAADQLDGPMTTKLNAERNVAFELPKQ